MVKQFSTARWILTGLLVTALVPAAGGDDPAGTTASAGAEDAEESAARPRPAPPALHLLETRVDLGSVYSGERVRHRFVYQNRGGSELVVKQIRPTCSTLVERWEREHRVLAPGREGSFVLARDTTWSGAARRLLAAYIESNDPQRPRIFVRAEVRVVPVLTLEPSSPRVDVLPDSPEGETVIKLTRNPDVKGQVRVVSVKSGEHLRLDLKETEPGSTWRLLARASRDLEGRSYAVDRIVLDVQVGKRRLEQKLHVSIHRPERIEASPRAVYFTRRDVRSLVPTRTPVSKTVTIGTVLAPPYRFRISRVRLEGPDAFEALFKTRIEPAVEGREYRLVVELVSLPQWIESPGDAEKTEKMEKAEKIDRGGKPTATKSRLVSGTITLVTDDPKLAEIRVPCRASLGFASLPKRVPERE